MGLGMNNNFIFCIGLSLTAALIFAGVQYRNSAVDEYGKAIQEKDIDTSFSINGEPFQVTTCNVHRNCSESDPLIQQYKFIVEDGFSHTSAPLRYNGRLLRNIITTKNGPTIPRVCWETSNDYECYNFFAQYTSPNGILEDVQVVGIYESVLPKTRTSIGNYRTRNNAMIAKVAYSTSLVRVEGDRSSFNLFSNEDRIEFISKVEQTLIEEIF